MATPPSAARKAEGERQQAEAGRLRHHRPTDLLPVGTERAGVCANERARAGASTGAGSSEMTR
eukprot:6433296-Alexandrium_andersonii.AAC.1